jgi:DNA modification methylase
MSKEQLLDNHKSDEIATTQNIRNINYSMIFLVVIACGYSVLFITMAININSMTNNLDLIIQFMTKELDYIMMSTIIWNKNTTGNRTAWGSYMSPSSPSFPSPFEFILIFAKDTKKKSGTKDKVTVSRDDFIKNAWGMWTFAPETRQKKIGLSAMFPEELPRRCIEMLSYKEDVVFDPFCGLGTTCLVAKRLERDYIGFEMSVDYCKKSRERIAND